MLQDEEYLDRKMSIEDLPREFILHLVQIIATENLTSFRMPNCIVWQEWTRFCQLKMN